MARRLRFFHFKLYAPDNEPPLIASAFEDNTDKSTYDIIGRFIYFEVSKKF